MLLRTFWVRTATDVEATSKIARPATISALALIVELHQGVGNLGETGGLGRSRFNHRRHDSREGSEAATRQPRVQFAAGPGQTAAHRSQWTAKLRRRPAPALVLASSKVPRPRGISPGAAGLLPG